MTDDAYMYIVFAYLSGWAKAKSTLGQPPTLHTDPPTPAMLAGSHVSRGAEAYFFSGTPHI